jgi:hypothetical protein
MICKACLSLLLSRSHSLFTRVSLSPCRTQFVLSPPHGEFTVCCFCSYVITMFRRQTRKKVANSMGYTEKRLGLRVLLSSSSFLFCLFHFLCNIMCPVLILSLSSHSPRHLCCSRCYSIESRSSRHSIPSLPQPFVLMFSSQILLCVLRLGTNSIFFHLSLALGFSPPHVRQSESCFQNGCRDS